MLLPGTANMQYLNLELIRAKKTGSAEVERVCAEAARAEPHISRVVTRSQLERGNCSRNTIGRAFTLGFFGPRSGDVFILQEPYYLFDSSGTSHGTPYGYDTHVPYFLDRKSSLGSIASRSTSMTSLRLWLRCSTSRLRPDPLDVF